MSNESSRFELTRRRLLGGVAVTGVAGAASGAGTWAYFRDTESSTGNTIDAGTLDLTVEDGEDVSGTWTLSNAKPGGDEANAYLVLRNDGSLSSDHLEMDFSVTETEADGPGGNNDADTAPRSANGMAEQFEVTRLIYDGTDILASLSNTNGNGIVDLGDLVTGNDEVLDDLASLPSDGEGPRMIAMRFGWADDSEFDNSVSGANNDYQGDELDLTVTFTLHQDSSQDRNDSQDS